jgi:predicted RNase H-like nuclease (RuvC/YqgF family)
VIYNGGSRPSMLIETEIKKKSHIFLSEVLSKVHDLDTERIAKHENAHKDKDARNADTLQRLKDSQATVAALDDELKALRDSLKEKDAKIEELRAEFNEQKMIRNKFDDACTAFGLEIWRDGSIADDTVETKMARLDRLLRNGNKPSFKQTMNRLRTIVTFAIDFNLFSININ